MKKVKFTGSFPKMYCQTYPFHFADTVKGKGYKTAFRDYVLPELEERFGSVFPKSKGWQHLHRKVRCRDDREFLLQKDDQHIHFRFIYKRGKKEPEAELTVWLFAANMKKFLPLLSQPLSYTEIGTVMADKKLPLVNKETLYNQCWTRKNETLIKNSLLAKIGNPGVKHKDPLVLCYEEMHGEDSVFPEVLCATDKDSYYRLANMESWSTFSHIACDNLRDLKNCNLVEIDQGKLRLVKKNNNPEFYVLKNVLDEDSTAEYELITCEKEDPMNGYVRELDYFRNTESPAFAFFTIKNKEGQEIFTKKFYREWGLLKKDMYFFIKEQKQLLRSMDAELKKKGSIAEEKKAELAVLLGEFGEAVSKTRPNKPVIKKDRHKKPLKVKGGVSSIEDITAICDFDQKMLLSALEGKTVTDADIATAKEAAKRLNEDDIYEFDFTNDLAFMKSVVVFMDTFSR